MKGRYTQKDFQAAAHESERKYDEGKDSRWYNKDKTGPFFPYLVTIAIGFSILSGVFYSVASSLNSMIPEKSIVTKLKITKKEYDENLPSFIVFGEKDGKQMKFKNKNSSLERKINDSEIQKELLEEQVYDLEVSKRKDDPINIDGNILEIKRHY